MTVTAPRWLDVNTVPLDTYAWRVVEGGYDELLNTAPLRGENLIMPGARGRRPKTPLEDEKPVSIPLLVIGAFTPDGDPIDDPIQGMLEHRDYLYDSLGLRTIVDGVFHRGGDLADWVGDLQPLGLYGWTTLGDGDAAVRLDLKIPDGELTEDGS